jgi:hypothetical protein
MSLRFNRSAAVAYARKHALSPNSAYHLYEVDCTNFVSQCMLQGGWTMITGWYRSDRVWWYTGGLFGWRAASYTWAAAQNFADFLSASGRGSAASGPADLDLADVIQIRDASRVYHSMIVTGRSGSDLLLSYHTTNRLDRPLSEIQRGLASGDSLLYWKIN